MYICIFIYLFTCHVCVGSCRLMDADGVALASTSPAYCAIGPWGSDVPSEGPLCALIRVPFLGPLYYTALLSCGPK